MNENLSDNIVYRRARINGNSCTIAMPKDCARKWYRREIDAHGRVITFTPIPETETKPSTAQEEDHEN